MSVEKKMVCLCFQNEKLIIHTYFDDNIIGTNFDAKYIIKLKQNRNTYRKMPFYFH